MKYATLIFYVCSLWALNSCDKDDGTLPEATRTGANTFGCLVNGELFKPIRYGPTQLHSEIYYKDNVYYFGIGSNSKDQSYSISIQGNQLESIGEGTYILGDQTDGSFYGHFTKSIIEDGVLTNILSFNTTGENPGTLTITRYDPENFIVSGTFEFTVIDQNGEEIHITDGRFDVEF